MAAKRRPDLPAPQVLIIAPGVRLSFGEVDRPFHTASAGKPFVLPDDEMERVIEKFKGYGQVKNG